MFSVGVVAVLGEFVECVRVVVVFGFIFRVVDLYVVVLVVVIIGSFVICAAYVDGLGSGVLYCMLSWFVVDETCILAEGVCALVVIDDVVTMVVEVDGVDGGMGGIGVNDVYDDICGTVVWSSVTGFVLVDFGVVCVVGDVVLGSGVMCIMFNCSVIGEA